MKKVIVSFAIILSSFFIFYSNVGASSINININNFDFYNDTFLEFKSKTEEYLSSSDYINYNIYYYQNANYYYACYFNSTMIFSTTGTVEIKNANCTKDFTTFQIERMVTNYFGNIYYYDDYLVSSNYVKTFSDNYVYVYNDFSYEIPSGTTFIYPYDFYLKYQENIIPPDPHKEEKEVLESFYTMSINKLKYLTTAITSNYIYLSIFVVFIFVFVVGLIKRRFI